MEKKILKRKLKVRINVKSVYSFCLKKDLEKFCRILFMVRYMKIIKIHEYLIMYEYTYDVLLVREEDTFYETVDQVLDGTYPKRSMILVLSKTPDILKEIGLDDLPITMTQKHLYTITNKSGKYKAVNYHNLGIDLIKKIPSSLRQPLKILLSNTKADSIVLVTDLIDNENRPVIASIKMNGEGRIGDRFVKTNVLTSVYGRNNYEKFIKGNIENNKILYDKDEGIIKELDIGDRVQFPMIEPSKDITSDNPKTAIQSSDKIVS